MQRSKAMKSVAFVTVILLLSWGCCQLFRPPNVEVVVPGRVHLTGWSLSPAGDKIAYTRMGGNTFVLFPETGRTYEFDDCGSKVWFDNDTLYCRGDTIILFKDGPHTGKLTTVRASEVDLENLLQAADRIYKMDRVSKFFFAFKDDIQRQPENSYLITKVNDIEAVLAEVDYITLYLFRKSVREFKFGEKVYSPNKKYYFIWENNTTLSIFEAATDEKLSAFKADILLLLGGWAADSSGVYFEIHQTSGFFSFPKPKVIRKLRVP